MNRKNRIVKSLSALGICAALGIGFAAVTGAPANAKGPCVCPMVYAPVICDNGKTYSNQCVADCRNATGCVPLGIGPVPF